MAQQLDPWRTLGLAPGASPEEVRRAYRTLAKANHPDAAGEAAVPRFLAIQAAYEMLIRPSARRRAGARPAASPADRPREPWRADPDRARSSGRADGRRPGARPTGPGSSSGGAPAGGTASGSRSGERGGTAGGSSAPGSSAPGSSSSGSARARRPSGRRRAPNKATPYSTSYDPGDEESFEPGWSGAGWYGAASGTYWTINPKEWADPRKHGPEYQRRARRAAGRWIVDDGEVPGPGDDEAGAAAADHAETDDAPRPDATWTDAGSADLRPDPAAESGTGRVAGPRFRLDWRAWIAQPPAGSRFRGPVLRPPSGSGGRLIVAFLGWAGLASIAATVLGEATGCSRFSVSCDDAAAPVSSIVLAGLFLALLALPAVATWLAHGTIAVFLFGIPASILLSATGGANQPEASAAVVTVVTVVAWIGGVAYAAILPRLGTVGPNGPPV